MANYYKENREKLLRELISEVRNNIDITEIKSAALKDIAKIFDLDRCFFIEFDENEQTLPIDKYSEYLVSKSGKSMVGVNLEKDYDFSYWTRQIKEAYIKNKQKVVQVISSVDYIKNYNLAGTKIEKYCIDFNFISGIAFTSFENEKIKAILVLNFKKEKALKQDEIEFTEAFADQVFIAYKQGLLYKELAQSVKKEGLLKEIISSSRSTTNIDHLLSIICKKVTKAMGVERTTITYYPVEGKFNEYTTKKEYRVNLNIKSVFVSKNIEKIAEYWGHELIKKGRLVAVDNIEESDEPQFFKKFFKKLNVNSVIGIPIKSAEEKWGVLVLSKVYGYKHWSNEDISFLKSIVDQIYLAIKQAELYTQILQQAKREALQRKLTEILRSTLEKEKFKKIAVREIGKAFEADRCFITTFDKLTNIVDLPNAQYTHPKENIAIANFELFKNAVQKFERIVKKEGILKVEDTQKMLEEKGLQGSEQDRYYKLFNIKSDYAVAVWSTKEHNAYLVIQYTRKKKVLTKEQIELLKAIANQVEIAFNQAELFEINKQTIEREMASRRIIDLIRVSYDLDIIKKNLVREAGKAVGASRAFICDYDYQNKCFLTPDINSEYMKNKNMVTLRAEGRDFAHLQYWTRLLLKKIEILQPSSEKLIKDNNLEGQPEEVFLNKYNIKSAIVLPIIYINELIGTLILHFDKPYAFSDNEVGFLRTITRQAAISMYQAKLFHELKSKTEREKLQREILNTIRSTLDIRKVKENIVKEIGRVFKSDRCYFRSYDKKKDKFLAPDVEYLKNKSVGSLLNKKVNQAGLEFFFEEAERQKKYTPLIVNQELIKKKHLDNTPLIEYFHQAKIQTDVAIPMWDRKDELSFLVLHYKKNISSLPIEDVELMEMIAKQVIIAIDQSRLYEELKQRAERETLIRTIIDTVRSSLELEDIKRKIINEVGKAFKPDRCYFRKLDKKTKEFLAPDYEYLSNQTSSIRDIRPHNEGLKQFINLAFSEDRMLMMQDVNSYINKKNLVNSPLHKYMKSVGVKSDYALIIKDTEKETLYLVLHYIKETIELPLEDIKTLEILAKESATAIEQSELYETVRTNAKKNQFLNELTNTLRQFLDINQLKKQITLQIGEYLNAERCVLHQIDIKTGKYMVIDEFSEYCSSESVTSYVGIDIEQEELQYFKSLFLTDKEMIVPDFPSYINSLKNVSKKTKEWIASLGIKSDYVFPIIYGGELLASLYITYNEKYVDLSQEQLDDVRFLVNQLGIAIKQAELHSEAIKQAEKEKLLRIITSSISNNLDINETKKVIVTNIGKLFNADQVYLSKFDEVNKIIMPVDEFSEYNPSKNKSIIGDDLEQYRFFTKILKNKKDIIINDIEDYSNKMTNLPDFKTAEKYIKRYELKSGIGFPILYQNNQIGLLVIQYSLKKHTFTKEELEYIKTIANQAGISLHQAKMFEEINTLYNQAQIQATKERILRDIVSEIKLTKNLDEAYNTLLEKIAEVYGLNRVLFLESSPFDLENLLIKYEYVIEREDLSINNLIFPKICIKDFLDLIHNFSTLVINNVSDCYPESHTLEFFDKYKIKSLLATPLIKYNNERKVLGFIILCSETVRTWSKYEIQLIKDISESIIGVIWEISKFIEIEDLKNTFIQTLAHDFRVPLVGEKTALKYLFDYTCIDSNKNKEIIKELIENNEQLLVLLNKSVEIYNYESGKKKLALNASKVSDLVEKSILSLEDYALSSSVKIDLIKSEQELYIFADRAEILKVFQNIIENAIENSPKNKPVIIKYYKQRENVLFEIKDFGKGIPVDIQEKIFKRYEMAVAIERKIGSGTGLFLSKRIVEAHHGLLWFETKMNKGTTFYISLPLHSTHI